MKLRQIPGYVGFYALDEKNRVVSLPRTITYPFGNTKKVGGKVLSRVASRNTEPVYRLSKNGTPKDIPLRRILEMVNESQGQKVE